MGKPNSRVDRTRRPEKRTDLDRLFLAVFRPILDNIFRRVPVAYKSGLGYILTDWRMFKVYDLDEDRHLFVDENGAWHFSYSAQRTGPQWDPTRYYFEEKGGSDPAEILALIPYEDIVSGAVRNLKEVIDKREGILKVLRRRRGVAQQIMVHRLNLVGRSG